MENIFPYTFSVGEVAIILCPWHPEIHDQECTIIGPLGRRKAQGIRSKALYDIDGYLVRAQNWPRDLHLRPELLRKKKPPEEKKEKITSINWMKLIGLPMEETA